MNKIQEPFIESLSRFENAKDILQIEYTFLHLYLDDENQELFAKAWTDIDEIINVLKDNI